MALQVWLPLNKDLRQQGLSTTTYTQNTGTTISSGGKLGSCLTATSNATVVVNLSSLATMLANGKTYSLACWVKITNNVANGWAIKLGTNNCGLWWAASEARWVWNENDNGKRCANPTISADTNWHHLCIVVDKTVANKITTKQYVDGALAAGYPGSTWNCSSHSQPAGTTITISPYVAQLNDIRLYDHCLSPMEVKELAKGLVLHYPLNRGGWGQENIIPNSKLDGSWTYPSSSYSDKYSTITTVIPSATQYTLSFDAKSTVNGDKMRTHYYSPNTTTTCVSSQGITKTAVDGNMDFTLSTQWQRYWVTYTQTETTAVKHLICPRLVSGQGSGTVSVKNVKLEEGSIATPWCPNSSDTLATIMGLNSTTEYDCSGFGNNGTRTGTFSWTSDTPRHNVSTNFDGSGIRIQSAALPIETKTISVWAKTTKNKNTAQCILGDSASGICMFIYGGGLITYFRGSAGGAGSRVTFGSEYKENDWNHLVVVKTGDTTRDAYCNGVKLATAANNFYTHAEGFWVGARNDSNQLPFYGQICDVRAYATALSADDVKSLYQNSAYIDSSGNVYGAVHEEV